MDEERPSAYLETTIPSYLVAKPSRDVITASHQQITHEWWATAKERFLLVVSAYVVAEIEAGATEYAERRLATIADLDVLDVSDDVTVLIDLYTRELGLTGKAEKDIPHFAFAVAYNVDYLVTWNCSHIANGHVIRKLVAVNHQIQRRTPIILTPIELLGLPSMEGE